MGKDDNDFWAALAGLLLGFAGLVIVAEILKPKCPKCGKPYSGKPAVCPHCGYLLGGR